MHLGYADPFDDGSSPEDFDFAEPLEEEDAATDPFEEIPFPENSDLVGLEDNAGTEPFESEPSPENFGLATLEEDAGTEPFEDKPSPENFGLAEPLEEDAADELTVRAVNGEYFGGVLGTGEDFGGVLGTGGDFGGVLGLGTKRVTSEVACERGLDKGSCAYSVRSSSSSQVPTWPE